LNNLSEWKRGNEMGRPEKSPELHQLQGTQPRPPSRSDSDIDAGRAKIPSQYRGSASFCASGIAVNAPDTMNGRIPRLSSET
jgi:hypothetical protein